MAFDRLQLIGWFATALTLASCFCYDPKVIRRVQAGAALVWISYGVAIAAPTIIGANVLVAGVAAWSSVRRA